MSISAYPLSTVSSEQVLTAYGVYTGFASYTDTLHTEGSPQVLVVDTPAILTNNAGTTYTAQIPTDITAFWDSSTNKITGRDGDNLDIMLYFKAKPSTQNQWMDIWIDIGGGVGELYRQTFSFPRGSGVERGILYALPSAYTLNTWEANGGVVYVESNAALDIYDKVFNFDRSHKGR